MMVKNWPLFLVIVLLGIAALILLLPEPAVGRTWYVDDDGEQDFERIQDAINASGEGDTIRVFSGSYGDVLSIDKSLTLMGNGSKATYIRSKGEGLEAVNISADGVTITGFFFRTDSSFTGNHEMKVGSGSTRISNNRFSYGATFVNSSSVILMNSTFGGVVELAGSHNTTMHNNSFSKLTLLDSPGAAIQSSTLSSKMYLLGSQDVTIHNNSCQGGIYLERSGNATITDNNLQSWSQVLYLEGASRNLIANNTFHGYSSHGIYLSNSDSNLLRDNTFPTYYYNGAIYLDSSHQNIITNNTLGGVITVESSQGTVITHNTIASDFSYRILLSSSANCSLQNNTSTGSGIFIEGDAPEHWTSHDIGPSNLIHGKPVIYHKNRDGDVVNPNAGLVILAGCTNMRVENLTIGNTFVGLVLGFSSNNTIVNSSFDRMGFYGAFLDRSDNNRFTNVTCAGKYGYTNYGFYLVDSAGNTFDTITATANSYDGISFLRSGQNRVTGSRFSGNAYFGIHLENLSSDNSFADNQLLENYWGMELEDSHHTVLENTSIADSHEYGIRLHDSTHATLRNTSLEGNGLVIAGDTLRYWNTHSIDGSNTVNDRPLRYYTNQDDVVVSRDAGQVVLANCSRVTVKDIDLVSSSGGLFIVYSHHISIENTTFSGGSYGMYLDHLNHSTIKNNICGRNDIAGVEMRNSYNNLLMDNVCISNDISGIALTHSDHNTLNNNSASGREYGILLVGSHHNGLTNNACAGRHGLALQDSNSNTLENNSGEYGTIRLSGSYDNLLVNNVAEQITLLDSDRNLLTGNTCQGHEEGIYLQSSDDNTLRNNSCLENYDGIVLSLSNHNLLKGNNCLGPRESGIKLSYSSDNILTGNRLEGGGIEFRGNLSEHRSSHDITSSNTLNGKPIYFYENETGFVVPSGAGQVILVNCSWMVVENQELVNGYIGLLLVSSSHITISNNNCSLNERSGIELRDSHNNTLSGNDCSYNRYGVYFDKSRDNTISLTTCTGNDWTGIELRHSNTTMIDNSTCTGNTKGISLFDSHHARVSFTSCRENEEQGVITHSSDFSVFRSNTIISNQVQGLYLGDSCGNTIQGNIISGNGVGIYLSHSSENNVVRYNDIYGNTEGINISTFQSRTINATENWWGHSSGPYHPGDNPNGSGNGVSDLVEFKPWSDERFREDPTIDQEEEGKDHAHVGLSLLLLTICAILILLVVVVRLPAERFRQERPSGPDRAGEPPLKPLQQFTNCPHCGGKFELPTRNRPIRFSCHFCGREIEFE